MPDGERKSSEDLIREANSRLRSTRSEPSIETKREQDDVVVSTPDRSPRVESPATGPASTPLEPSQPPVVPEPAPAARSSLRWVVWVVVAIVAAGWNFITSIDDADRDGSGEIVAAGDLDVMTVEVGDCFDDPEESEGIIFEVAAVPCSEAHDNEVFAVQVMEPGLAAGAYPGRDTLEQRGYETCAGQIFDSYVGTPYPDSALEVFPLTPSEESWDQGDREIVCVLYRLDLAKLTGTARGSGL